MFLCILYGSRNFLFFFPVKSTLIVKKVFISLASAVMLIISSLIGMNMLQVINIEGLSLDKFLEHQVANSGWILEKGQGRGQLIVLPRNEFNHPELKRSSADSIPLEHVTRIFPILGWFIFLLGPSLPSLFLSQQKPLVSNISWWCYWHKCSFPNASIFLML